MTRFREKIATIMLSESRKERKRERKTLWNINEKSPKIPNRLKLCEFREGNFIVTETKQRTLPFKEFSHSRTEDTSFGHDYRAFLDVRWIASRIRTFCWTRDIL